MIVTPQLQCLVCDFRVSESDVGPLVLLPDTGVPVAFQAGIAGCSAMHQGHGQATGTPWCRQRGIVHVLLVLLILRQLVVHSFPPASPGMQDCCKAAICLLQLPL